MIFLKQFARIGLLSAAGGVSLYHLNGFKEVHNSFVLSPNNPQSKWDHNWDFRAPTSLVKPLPENASAEKQNEYNSKLEKQVPTAVRNIILIRHGQYEYRDTDAERVLTKLGREQAELTGKRLEQIRIPIDNVVVSTMTRAQETANIILKQLSLVEGIERVNCKLMEEGAVYKPSK
jgi:serine/threonine-protein phosphatase PGAM5